MLPATRIPRGRLEHLLFDDVPFGDLTTDLLGLASQSGAMTFAARSEMTLALSAEAATILELAGARVERLASDGKRLGAGDLVLRAKGPADALLRGWKVAQTLIETWSGVASAARDIVEAARAVAPGITVACTRKNIPGAKDFSVAAIRAGGAVMHRLGLSETILLFPEHRLFLAGMPLEQVATRLRAAAPEKKLVIEVANVDEALAAAHAGFDVIQAEKFSPADIAILAARLSAFAKRPVLAAAGGVKRDNAADYARAGANVLVTSAPYAASPRDVAVAFSPEQ